MHQPKPPQIPRFFSCNRGAALITVSLSMALLIILFAMVTDMSRIYAAQNKAQHASDASLLGAVATHEQTPVQGEMERLFAGNYPESYLDTRITNIEVTQRGDVFNSKLMLHVPSIITGVFSSDLTNIPIRSQATIFPATKLEISLVLDNTGSMTGTKIQALRNASSTLVDILFGDAATLDNLFISVVPYDIAVNIGTGRAGWIQAPSLAKYNAHAALSPPKGFAFNRFTDFLCGPYVLISPGYCWPASCDMNLETGVCTPYPAGCGEPGLPYNDYTCVPNGLNDVSDAPPTTADAKFRLPYENWIPDDPDDHWISPADRVNHEYIEKLSPILFASNNKATVQSALTAMQISGATRIPVGLMWGWFTLSPRWQGLWDAARPTMPMSTEPNLLKTIVLMTDGLNSWASQGDDNKTAALCSAIKAQNITIYTVGFGGASEVNGALLQGCASQPGYYFHAPSEAELQEAFEEIAQSIIANRLKLTQ